MNESASISSPRLSGAPLLYGWYTVVLLTLAYILSFVDRYILGLLIGPIKADMGLSDTEIGLLLGPAFATFYVLMGLPLGWLADRARRTWIVGAGILLWSTATAFCGLARNFMQLGLARVGVGIGEATLSPCALSMIADRFPEEQRGKPVAFYAGALSVGAGIASLAGASVLAWTASRGVVDVPLVGAMAPWQFTFLVVALPGIPLALLMLTLREPPRQSSPSLSGKGVTMGQALREVAANWRAYGGLVSLVCVMTIVAYSQGWMPAMFERTWGWAPQQYALYNGIGLLLLGPLTVNLAGWWSDRLRTAGHADAPLRIVMVGVLVLVPTGALAPLMPSGEVAFALLLVNTVGIALLSACAPTALLNITPGPVRGQVVAMYYISISLAGLLLGPTTIGLLNDHVFGENGIRYSAALVPLIFGVPVLLCLGGIRRAYLIRVEAMA